MKNQYVVALGVFLGNWLVIPLIFKRTFMDGFYIGLIAAVLVLLAYRWILE